MHNVIWLTKQKEIASTYSMKNRDENAPPGYRDHPPNRDAARYKPPLLRFSHHTPARLSRT
jgi:hypothetical protein